MFARSEEREVCLCVIKTENGLEKRKKNAQEETLSFGGTVMARGSRLGLVMQAPAMVFQFLQMVPLFTKNASVGRQQIASTTSPS